MPSPWLRCRLQRLMRRPRPEQRWTAQLLSTQQQEQQELQLLVPHPSRSAVRQQRLFLPAQRMDQQIGTMQRIGVHGFLARSGFIPGAQMLGSAASHQRQ